jgi:hypothetical protein
MMTIKCDTMTDFVEVIRGLVEKGLTFEAHTLGLTITLTGGF